MDLTMGLLIVILVLVLLSMLTRTANGLPSRLAAMDRKLDLILTKLEIDPHQGADQDIIELVKAGQKIAAIKLYRERTGCELKEAKDYVEGLET